jgi:hypothetical protein
MCFFLLLKSQLLYRPGKLVTDSLFRSIKDDAKLPDKQEDRWRLRGLGLFLGGEKRKHVILIRVLCVRWLA